MEGRVACISVVEMRRHQGLYCRQSWCDAEKEGQVVGVVVSSRRSNTVATNVPVGSFAGLTDYCNPRRADEDGRSLQRRIGSSLVPFFLTRLLPIPADLSALL